MDGTITVQKCIPMKGVNYLLDYVPTTIEIKELVWEVDYQRPWIKLQVSDHMLKAGLKGARHTSSRTNVKGTFRKSKSRGYILKTIGQVAKEYDVPEDRFIVKKVVLRDRNNTECIFRMMRKNEQLPNDRRKKLVVLGLCNKNGKIKVKNTAQTRENELLAELGAEDVRCRVIIEVKKLAVCTSNFD